MQHAHMKFICTVMTSLALLAGCSSVARIDGSSDASFEQSHAKLMKSLAPEDQLRLLLAEMLIMEPRGCMTSEPIPGQALLTSVLGGQAVIRTCRKELHGMSFEDIMSLAYPSGSPAAQAQPRPN